MGFIVDKVFSKKLVCLIMIMSILLGNTAFAHWAESTINSFVERDIVKEDIDISDYNRPITYREIVNISANLFEHYNDYSYIKNLLDFTEISDFGLFTSRQEYSKYFMKTVIGDNKLKEAIKIVFSDEKDIDKDYLEFVTSLNGSIFIGYPDKSFKPKNEITLAEFLTTLKRFEDSYLKASEIDDEELVLVDDEEVLGIEVGILDYNDSNLEVNEVEDKIELESGDLVTLSLSLPNDIDEEDILIEVEDESVVSFIQEFFMLEALKEGKTKISFKTEDGELEKIIDIVVK